MNTNNIISIVQKLLLMTFSIGFCYFGTEILFISESNSFDMELIKQEYFESLFVGFCASITMIIGMLVLQKKKSNKRL